MDLSLVMQGDFNTATNPTVGDLLIVDNQLVMESTSDLHHLTEQDLYIRLNHFLGEWYLDRREGIPYFRTMFRKGFSLSAIDSMFRRALLASPYVREVIALGFELDRSARSMAVEFTVLRVDAEVSTFPPFIIELET